MKFTPLFVLAIVLALATPSSAAAAKGRALLLRATKSPKGPGFPEATMEAACGECSKHAENIADCTCFATDVMGTFEDDATKVLTTREEYGFKTENTGEERLNQGWLWHCRPITASE